MQAKGRLEKTEGKSQEEVGKLKRKIKETLESTLLNVSKGNT
jgi:uncharacterized protein YjbJ (UPF0337 family)